MQWEREVIIIRLVSLQCNKTEIEWSLQLIRAKKKIYGKSKWKLIVKTSKLPEACCWEGSASFSYSINAEKEKPKQRRITFKALFDWGSLNQNQSNCNSLSEERKISWRTKRTKSKPLKARENAGGQVAIGVNFASDWSREWREFCGPITEQSKAKAMQSRTTFDTQSKIAPYESFLVYVVICNLFSNIV